MADGDSEEAAIRDYFNKGFTYDEILALSDKYHGVGMSKATLKRRLKEKKKSGIRCSFSSRQDQMDPTAWEAIGIFGIPSRCKVYVFLALLSKPCLENWIPKERRKEGRTAFVEGPTGTMGQMIHGTAMGMINSNLSAFQFMPASMDGAERCYGCM